MLILTTDWPLTPGETLHHQSVSDGDGKWYEDITFKVLRVASRDEYILQEGLNDVAPRTYFYEVAMD